MDTAVATAEFDSNLAGRFHTSDDFSGRAGFRETMRLSERAFASPMRSG